MRKMKETEQVLVNLEELCELLSCGRRTAEKIGTLAKAEVRIGRIKRWSVDKIREFIYLEAM